MTPVLFAQALLNALRLPVTDNNVQAIVAAQAVEGGFMHNAAAFNPLNTTQPMPGSHPVTGVGVQAYASWQQGLDAIVKTLRNGLYNDILGSLSKSAAPDDTLRVWQLNPNYGWYHCEDPSTGQRYPDGVCLAGSKKVPNPIGTAASYAWYGQETFPSGGGSVPVGTPSLGSSIASSPIARLGVLGALGYGLYRLLPLVTK